MTIQKKKVSKRKPKRKNPNWSWKSLFTKPGDKGDSIYISVIDGDIILTGKRLPENYRTIFGILESELKDFKIEFKPNSSSTKYTKNRYFSIKSIRINRNL